MITSFLHFLGIFFGVAGIGCAVGAVMNMFTALVFPKNMDDEAWFYAKKSYIFLGFTILFIVVGYFLNTL